MNTDSQHISSGAEVFARDSFKLQKRRQFFFRSRNETLSVAAMSVSNEDYWAMTI
jgi:hypothetical protein